MGRTIAGRALQQCMGEGQDSPGHNCSRGCLANPWWTSQHEGLLAEVLGLAASLRLDFNLLTFQVYPVPVLQPPVLSLQQ